MIVKFENINYTLQDKFVFTLADAGYKVWIEKFYKEYPRNLELDHVYVCVEVKDN
jgi:hypothetical protein